MSTYGSSLQMKLIFWEMLRTLKTNWNRRINKDAAFIHLDPQQGLALPPKGWPFQHLVEKDKPWAYHRLMADLYQETLYVFFAVAICGLTIHCSKDVMKVCAAVPCSTTAQYLAAWLCEHVLVGLVSKWEEHLLMLVRRWKGTSL